jgi:hypothetical protein
MCDWIRLPGLFHRRELGHVVVPDGDQEYRFELVGRDAQGRDLVAVHLRGGPSAAHPGQLDLPGVARARTARAASCLDGGAS